MEFLRRLLPDADVAEATERQRFRLTRGWILLLFALGGWLVVGLIWFVASTILTYIA